MKIEIGESIILSWLRHEKNCQIVQMNWKPSTTTWVFHNEKDVQNILNYFKEKFMDEYNLDLFKKSSSVNQIIKQGEIDALGIELIGDKTKNIFAVDVAFHENGLNYKSTTSSVLKKMIRSAITILGYLNKRDGEIIFATPKIKRIDFIELDEYISVVEKDFNEKWNCNFGFQILANYEFYKRILSPITKISKEIADTSELFVRSIQLYSLFNKNIGKYSIEKIQYLTKGCFGTCPIFEITIDKNGKAKFVAEAFNFVEKFTKEIEGRFKTTILASKYKSLVELLNYMNFPNLKNNYSSGEITDLPSSILKVTYNNGKVKVINDYGMSGTVELIQLYSIIDKLRFDQNWKSY